METRIKELREARGLTVEQLAILAGYSKSYTSELETGKKQINARALAAFSKALKVTPVDLIEDADMAGEIHEHIKVMRRLPKEDQEAVMRHARGLGGPSEE